MNFFGHAVVAARRSESPAFVLGAMLPDFATMLGTKVPGAEHHELVDGIAFHHATDRAFHEAPTFRTLQADARQALRALGLPRPAALAVGHIGIELLLDTILAKDTVGLLGYLRALECGGPESFGALIRWNDPDLHGSWERLRGVLLERGVDGAAHPAAVAERVARALSARPRFRLDAEGREIVLRWAESAQLVVHDAADVLMFETRRGL